MTEDQALAGRVAALLAAGTATVSDALGRLGLPGSAHGIAPLTNGLRMAGPAYTVRYVPRPGSSTARVSGTGACSARDLPATRLWRPAPLAWPLGGDWAAMNPGRHPGRHWRHRSAAAPGQPGGRPARLDGPCPLSDSVP
jgi:hypothetical protein